MRTDDGRTKLETVRHVSGFGFLLDEWQRNAFSEESNSRDVNSRD